MFTHSKNILIGMLLTSAITLAVALVVTQPEPKRAEAGMMSQQGDIVLLTTGTVGNDDLLHVIDVRNGKMVTYGWNTMAKRMQPCAALNIFAR